MTAKCFPHFVQVALYDSEKKKFMHDVENILCHVELRGKSLFSERSYDVNSSSVEAERNAN